MIFLFLFVTNGRIWRKQLTKFCKNSPLPPLNLGGKVKLMFRESSSGDQALQGAGGRRAAHDDRPAQPEERGVQILEVAVVQLGHTALLSSSKTSDA